MDKLYVEMAIDNQTTSLEAKFPEDPTWVELLPYLQSAMSGAGYVLPSGVLYLLEDDEVVVTKEELSTLDAAKDRVVVLQEEIQKLRKRIAAQDKQLNAIGINND